MPADDQPWFSVRCLFSLEADDHGKMYEERITIWRADSFSSAIEAAEKEAEEYAQTRAPKWTVSYVGLAQCFHLFVADRPLKCGDEVYSLLRDSKLSADKYINRFFDTGRERQGHFEEPRS